MQASETNKENLDLFITKIEDSFKKQDNFDYEIIFVDDYSSDNSFEILKKRMKLNNKIKIIKMKKDMGTLLQFKPLLRILMEIITL